jgi:recombination protein RecA
MTDKRIEVAAKIAQEATRRYGHKSAFAGTNPWESEVIPSGILSYDLMSGLRGHPRNAIVEVFGPPEIGKTTIMGYSALREAQKMGLLTGIIATEPKFDSDWVQKNGVNPDYNVTAFPDNLDQAFEILHDWVYDGTLDYVLFDSLVGASTEADQDEGAKARPGGLAKTITWNLQRIVPRMFKNNVGVMFVNQVRDNQQSRIPGMLDSPGGWALRHLAICRVELKPGRNRYVMKINGDDKLVGREVIANFKKANGANATGNKARFDFFHVDTDGEYPFGIDVTSDVINTAKIAKVFEGTAWLHHHLFPDGKLHGKEKVAEWIQANPEKLDIIRNEVLAKIEERKVAQREKLRAVK